MATERSRDQEVQDLIKAVEKFFRRNSSVQQTPEDEGSKEYQDPLPYHPSSRDFFNDSAPTWRDTLGCLAVPVVGVVAIYSLCRYLNSRTRSK